MPYQMCKAAEANLLTPASGACYFDLGIFRTDLRA
jgi:hypothetical protein